jgi:hypothetical protein
MAFTFPLLFPQSRMLSSTRSRTVAFAAFLAPFALGAQPLPTPAEIVARHVAAIGGAALNSVTSVKQTGVMSMAAMGLSGQSEALFLLPNKNSTKVVIGAIGEVVTGTDGDVAWSINAMQGPRVLTEQELAQTKESADFLGQMLMLADRFSATETIGMADFSGEKAYKVRFVSKNTGMTTFRFFSVASGLLLGQEATSVTAMGSVEARVTFSDYKSFGGVKFPTKTETSIGPQTISLVTSNIEFNVVPAGAVVVPDAIKALIKKD